MNVKAKQAAIADLVNQVNAKAKTNVIKEQKPKQEVKAPEATEAINGRRT